jgi:hypothetical protein
MHTSTTIYFFQAGETDRYALSIDKTGCNVALAVPSWLLRGELDPDEFPDDLTPALKHLVRHGFSILNVVDGPQDVSVGGEDQCLKRS